MRQNCIEYPSIAVTTEPNIRQELIVVAAHLVVCLTSEPLPHTHLHAKTFLNDRIARVVGKTICKCDMKVAIRRLLQVVVLDTSQIKRRIQRWSWSSLYRTTDSGFYNTWSHLRVGE